MNKSQIAKNLNSKSEDLELIKLGDLKLDTYYLIKALSKTTNKFGRDCVIATIKQMNKSYKTFLPTKYCNWSQEQLNSLIGLEFVYLGKEKGKNHEYHKLHFKEDYDSQEESDA